MRRSRLLGAVLLLAACKHGSTARGPHARGALVFDADAVYGSSPPSAERAKTFFATQGAVIESQRVRERAEIDAGAVDASRRGESLVLEITVTGPDARARCDRLLETYIDDRMQQKTSALRDEVLALDDMVADSGDAGAITARRDQLEVESRLHKSDVRVLEPCAIVR